tara:strand:+ start:930 stop:1292 length:363 start_codon:yes stop_codon:yes gene_type:complete
MKDIILVLFTLAFSTVLSAQSKSDITFGVSASCGMCEERIETAYDVKGIVMADYVLKTKKLHVVYKTKVFPDVLDVHRIAANVGHDTEKVKATDEAYNSLHNCCKYRAGVKKCSDGIDPD